MKRKYKQKDVDTPFGLINQFGIILFIAFTIICGAIASLLEKCQ